MDYISMGPTHTHTIFSFENESVHKHLNDFTFNLSAMYLMQLKQKSISD